MKRSIEFIGEHRNGTSMMLKWNLLSEMKRICYVGPLSSRTRRRCGEQMTYKNNVYPHLSSLLPALAQPVLSPARVIPAV